MEGGCINMWKQPRFSHINIRLFDEQVKVARSALKSRVKKISVVKRCLSERIINLLLPTTALISWMSAAVNLAFLCEL